MHRQEICTAQSRGGHSSWEGEKTHNRPEFADHSVGKRPAEGYVGAGQEAAGRGTISCRKPQFMTTDLVFIMKS